MRERYWTFFCSLKHQEFYYKYFQQLFNRINWFITAILTLTTLSCIASLDLWKEHQLLWATIICVAQIIQALFPKLPYNDCLVSTGFMISALSELLIKVEHDWLYIDIHQLSDDEILQLLHTHQAKHCELINQFFSGFYLPTIPYCEDHAEADCKNFFNINYPVKEAPYEQLLSSQQQTTDTSVSNLSEER